MYAERPRLGALGSVMRVSEVVRVLVAGIHTLLLLCDLVGAFGGLAGGGLFLGHDDGCSDCSDCDDEISKCRIQLIGQ